MLQFTYNFWTSAYPNFNKTLMLLLTSADHLLVSHTDAETELPISKEAAMNFSYVSDVTKESFLN